MPPESDSRRPLTQRDMHGMGQSICRLRDALGFDFRQKPKVSEIIAPEKMDSLLSRGMWAEAEAPLRTMLEENPLNRFAILGLIRVYSYTGRLAQAEALLDYAVDRGLVGDGMFSAMAEGYCHNGKGLSAAIVFDMAAARGMLSRRICNCMLSYVEATQDGKTARKIFEKAQEAGIADERIFSRTIAAMVRSGDMDSASELFREQRRALGSVRSYTSMIKGFASSGQLSRVAWYFEEAVERKMADAQLVSFTIRAYDAEDFPKLARDAYLKALRNGVSGHEMHREMLDVFLRRRQTRNAVEILDVMAKHNDAYPVNYYDVISLLHNEGRAPEACTLASRCCTAGRLDATAMEFIFGKLYGESRYGCIVSLFEAIPDAVRREPRVILKAADALRKLGRYTESMALLEDMLIRFHLDLESRFRARAIIGFCLKDSGRKEEAMRLFLELYRTVPKDFLCADRINCGLVFCWDELRYRGGVRDDELKAIHLRMKAALQTVKNGLREDIIHAIEALERSAVLEDPEYAYESG